MKIVIKPDVLEMVDIYKKFLEHISNSENEEKLSKTEIEILAAFWEVQGQGMEGMRFSPQVKKLIRDKFGFKNHANLENYIKSLKSKGYIQQNKYGVNIIAPRIDFKKPLSNLTITYEYRLQENS